MNLYQITTDDQTDPYDFCLEAIVVAEDEREAAAIHPNGEWDCEVSRSGWARSPEYVEVHYLGTTDIAVSTVLCVSRNNG